MENVTNITSTVHSLLNLTTIMTTAVPPMGKINSTQSTLSPSYQIYGNSSSYGNNSIYGNNSSYGNNNNVSFADPCLFNPYAFYCNYPQVIVTSSPPIYAFSYAYLYYLFLLLLVFVAIICVKLGINRKNQLAREAAAARSRARTNATAASGGNTTNNNNSNDNNNDLESNSPKEFDLPPAYNDVMQSYIIAKQQQPNDPNQEVEGGINSLGYSTQTLSTAISTVTINDEIPYNANDSNAEEANTTAVISTIRINNVPSNTTASTTIVSSEDVLFSGASSLPPTYDIIMKSNEHIV